MNLQQAKALFFAQYLGQAILKCISRPDESFKVLAYDCTPSETTNFLLLRSVHQLTDEHALILKNTLNVVHTTAEEWIDLIIKFQKGWGTFGPSHVREYAIIIDVLKRLGYLVRFNYINESGVVITLDPDEIIALKWAQYQID